MICLAAHADWSVAPGKRWMSVAVPAGAGWHVRTERVGEVATLLPRLRSEAGSAPLALGVDAPIGLPQAYAALHARAHRNFPSFLSSLQPDSPFFRVCETIEEVGPARPFFPRSTANSPRRLAQAARLGADHPDDLLRRCDRKTAARPRAACLFWTLGPNQVGKAALTLWRDLLLPARAAPEPPRLWPFEGRLAALLHARGSVVAETYPAEAMRQLGLAFRGSKRRQADRLTLAPAIEDRMRLLDAAAEAALATQIATGFGADPAGEDRLDSLVGLLGLLQVIRQPERDVLPPDGAVLRFEGWILGQAPEAG